MTDDRQQTQLIALSLAHAHGVMMSFATIPLIACPIFETLPINFSRVHNVHKYATFMTLVCTQMTDIVYSFVAEMPSCAPSWMG